MAASWLRISEVFTSFADTICVVARLQSINRSQRTLIIYDDDDYGTSSSSTLNVSLASLRTSVDLQSSVFAPGQCIQIYGRVVRQAGDISRIDAYFIRQLARDFDLKEYFKGLTLTRQYMASVESVSSR